MKLLVGSLCAAGIGLILGRITAGDLAQSADKAPPPPSVEEQRPVDAVMLETKGAGGSDTSWRSWAERIVRAKVASDLEAIYLEVTAVDSDWEVPHEVRLLLAARWVEIDPAAGLRFLNEEMKRQPSWLLGQQRSALLVEWAMLDPEAVRTEVAKLSKTGGKSVTEAVLAGLLQRDPAGALAYARASGDLGSGGGWLDSARTDPEGFAALVLKLRSSGKGGSEGGKTRDLLGAAATALVERDPDRALEWARGLPEWMREDGLGPVIEGVAMFDPVRAGELSAELTGRPIANAKMGAEQAVFRELLRLDLNRGLDWVDWNKSQRTVTVSLALAPMLESGELSATEVYHALHGRALGYGGGVFDELPASNRAEVEAAILGGDDNSWVRKKEAESLVDIASRYDLAGGFSFLLKLDGAARQEALSALGGRLGEYGFDVIDQLPSGDRAPVIAVFLRDRDGRWPAPPATFGERIAAEPDSATRNLAAGRLAADWGGFDPSAALRWAGSFGEGEAGLAAAEGAVASWALVDPISLSEHLVGLPNGAVRDGGSAGLVSVLIEDDLAAARTWAEQIGHAATRTRLLDKIKAKGGDESS